MNSFLLLYSIASYEYTTAYLFFCNGHASCFHFKSAPMNSCTWIFEHTCEKISLKFFILLNSPRKIRLKNCSCGFFCTGKGTVAHQFSCLQDQYCLWLSKHLQWNLSIKIMIWAVGQMLWYSLHPMSKCQGSSAASTYHGAQVGVSLPIPIQIPTDAHLVRQQIMAQEPGPLPPIPKT